MARTCVMTTGRDGLEIFIEYNASNLRITQVTWALAANSTARVRIWNNGNLVVTRTIVGPAAGSESIPGNHRMVEVTETGEPYLRLPYNLTWDMIVEASG